MSDDATEYLVSRAEGAPAAATPPELMAGLMFFQMWKTRQDPYQVLAEGDTLWWADQRSREVRWELRVGNLRQSQYRSLTQAMDWLRRWYGILPSDLTDYQNHQHREGWLLAWEHEIVAPVGVTLPNGEKLGRNGFRRISSVDGRRFGLPTPGRPALFVPEPITTEPNLLAPPRARTIPQATKTAVWKRDGATCRICGRTEGPWHIDHIFPFSKGGSNDIENLRVVCATCNLRKGAAIHGDAPIVPVIPELIDAARISGAVVPSSVNELQDLVANLVTSGRSADALRLAWALESHPDASFQLIDALVDALGPVPGDEARLFRVWHLSDDPVAALYELTRSDDPAVAGRAAAEASRTVEDDSQRLRYARQAREQAIDPTAQAVGALVIGELAEDDDEWRDELFFAYDHGDAFTAAMAAVWLGADIDNDELAYTFLEEATRAPSLEIASVAARLLAERFAGEPAIAERYTAMYELLEQQLGEETEAEAEETSESTELGGYADLVRTLERAGLPAPPVPEHLRPAVRRLGEWRWGTIEIGAANLYMLYGPGDSDEGFVFGHVGHGFNSYFLVYAWWNPTHAVVSRKSWGGAYSGSEVEPVVEFFDQLRSQLHSPPARVRKSETADRKSTAAGGIGVRRRARASRGLPPE